MTDLFAAYLDDEISLLQRAHANCQQNGHLGAAAQLDITLKAYREVRAKYLLLAAPPF